MNRDQTVLTGFAKIYVHYGYTPASNLWSITMKTSWM